MIGLECHKLGLVSGLLFVELLGFQQPLGLQLSLQLVHLPRRAHLGVATLLASWLPLKLGCASLVSIAEPNLVHVA